MAPTRRTSGSTYESTHTTASPTCQSVPVIAPLPSFLLRRTHGVTPALELVDPLLAGAPDVRDDIVAAVWVDRTQPLDVDAAPVLLLHMLAKPVAEVALDIREQVHSTRK